MTGSALFSLSSKVFSPKFEMWSVVGPFSTDPSSRTGLAWNSICGSKWTCPFRKLIISDLLLQEQKAEHIPSDDLEPLKIKLPFPPHSPRYILLSPSSIQIILMAGIGFLLGRAQALAFFDPCNVLSWTYVISYTYLQNWIVKTRLGYLSRDHWKRSEEKKKSSKSWFSGRL